MLSIIHFMNIARRFAGAGIAGAGLAVCSNRFRRRNQYYVVISNSTFLAIS
jgi:hypothetical protein